MKHKPTEGFQFFVPAMKTWDQDAAVRSKPFPTISRDEVEEGKFFYSPDLAPILHHPLIQKMDMEAKKKIFALYFRSSSLFTDWIEDRVVIPVSIDLANQSLGLDLNIGLRLDARNCVADEAHHSNFTSRVEEKVRVISGVGYESKKQPLFYRKLMKALHEAPAEIKHLILLGFSICSETLITGTLATVHRDEKVVSGIRDMFLQHSQDEARHSALFGAVFETMLPQLSDEQKRLLLPMFPDFIRWFTEPDTEYLIEGMKSLHLDLTDAQVEQIVAESYPLAIMDKIVNEAARPAVKILAAKGIFRDPQIRDAFAERKLF